jgi:hypothetical protein
MTETPWRELHNAWLDGIGRVIFLAQLGEFDDALAELDRARRIQDELTVVEQGLFAGIEACFPL